MYNSIHLKVVKFFSNLKKIALLYKKTVFENVLAKSLCIKKFKS